MVKFTKYWTREYSLWYEMSALESFQKWLQEEIGEDIVSKGEFENGWWTTFAQVGSIEKVSEKYVALVENDLEGVDKRINRLIKSGENLISFVKTLDGVESREGLLQNFSKYFENFVDFCVSLWACYYLVEAVEAAIQKEVVLKYGDGKSLLVISSISTPLKKASIIRLTDKLSSQVSFEEKVEFMVENFAYIGSTDPFEKPFGRVEVENYVRGFSGSEEKVEVEEVDSSLLDPKLVLVYQKLLWVKDLRDELRRDAFYLAYPFLKKVSTAFGLSVLELGNFLPAELTELSENWTANEVEVKKLISDRKKAIVATYDGEFTIISGGKAYDMIHENDSDVNLVSEFNGKVGCLGKVEGEVYVLKSEKDIANFPAGAVLVATTTNPNYLPAMNKAIAFVTDEGGITSHAAIVARELGVPCIVGCKVAMKVLKSGDKVEVDAEKGIVRRIGNGQN